MEETTGKQRSTQRKKEFLTAYRELFTIYHACKKVGVSRSCYYKWMREDPEFAKAATLAEEDNVNILEGEARRRAFEGWDEPVFFKGEEQGTVRKYSDTLLIFLLKGAAPEKYRERVEEKHTRDVTLKVVYENGDKRQTA